jgi:uncharacterized membrane protein YeaQ/YmgE (transglycosylase-associated protein family)
MKIYFPKYHSTALLTTKRDARWIIAFTIVCFFVGVCGSYLLENNSGSLTVVALGIAGIFVCFGGAMIALLGRGQADGVRDTRIRKTVPRIRPRWDYRPRQAIRRCAAIDSARAETSDVLSPEPFTINNSYINA